MTTCTLLGSRIPVTKYMQSGNISHGKNQVSARAGQNCLWTNSGSSYASQRRRRTRRGPSGPDGTRCPRRPHVSAQTMTHEHWSSRHTMVRPDQLRLGSEKGGHVGAAISGMSPPPSGKKAGLDAASTTDKGDIAIHPGAMSPYADDVSPISVSSKGREAPIDIGGSPHSVTTNH